MNAAAYPEPPAPAAGRLAAAFAILLAAVVGLMVLGALVRAHGAGLACPDWPLCFGEFVPAMDVKVAFEWSHRLIAGGVSIVFLALAGLTARRPELFERVRGLLLAAAIFLAIQVLLGALTVWQLLAVWTVTAHLVTANLFALALLLVALRLRRIARGDPPALPASSASPAARTWLWIAALLLAVQIVLGGLVSSSFAGMACPEWPACLNGEWFPAIGGNVALHLLHRTNGYLVLAALLGAVLATRGQPGTAGPARAALALALTQVAVGVANVLLALPVEITGLHSALAAALVLSLGVCLSAAHVGRTT
jgi:heme A synthase